MLWGFRALEIKVMNPGTESNKIVRVKNHSKQNLRSKQTATTTKETSMKLLLKKLKSSMILKFTCDLESLYSSSKNF